MKFILRCALGVLILAGIGSRIASGQANIMLPRMGMSSGFYEQFGVDVGASGPNWFFNQGSSGSAWPPFGGYQPQSGAQFGWGLSGSQGRMSFRMTAAEGSNRSITSVAPSVTLPNGGFGSFSAFQQFPFVAGLIPVVGQPPVAVQDRLGRYLAGERPEVSSWDVPPSQQDIYKPSTIDRSSAARGAASLDALRQAQAVEDQRREARRQELLAEADRCEQAGKTGVAHLLRQQAARLDD